MVDVIGGSEPEKAEISQCADRLQTFRSAQNRRGAAARDYSRNYSVFIKGVRVVFPLLALCLVVLLFSWNKIGQLWVDDVSDDALPLVAPVVRVITKNELLNPRFESVDEKGNPYIITAKRASQGQSNEDDLVILDEPLADVVLDGGRWLAVKAAQAAFRQETQRLLLKGDVEIFHDEGYRLYTQEMDVDMVGGYAKSSVDVRVQGPKGVLDAKGLHADRTAGLLVFKGPAKLVLSGGGL